MITCTSLRFDRQADGDDGQQCGEPATRRVTITGADRAVSTRPESPNPTPWNLDREPRCKACARMDRGIVTRLFPGATFDEDEITAELHA